MRALICQKPFELAYTNIDLDDQPADATLLKITRIGICGTDLHAYEGTQPFFSYPRILGHELAAEIVETNAAGFSIGEKVTFIPYFNCGSCVACSVGKPNCCIHLKVFGVHINGGMREYVWVPSSHLIHGDGLSDNELALLEPLAIGAHGVARANIEEKEFVLITGAGPIGLAAIEFAKLQGAVVIVADVNESRLQFCQEKLGIYHTVNPRSEDISEKLASITNGNMCQVVIDATGNLNAINQGFRWISHGGRYVLIGLQKENIEFSHPEFHKREATLMSSRNATRSDFQRVKEAVLQGKINPLDYITHSVPFDGVKDQFASWLQPRSEVIKAMITF